MLAVPFGGERLQAFLGELPGRVADLLLFVIRQHGDSLIQAFDGHGRGFAAADADRRDAALQAFLAQGREQGHQDPRAGRADRVAQGAGATMDVDLVVGISSFCMVTRLTTAKASLISNSSTWSSDQPVFFSSFLIAPTGATGNSPGVSANAA